MLLLLPLTLALCQVQENDLLHFDKPSVSQAKDGDEPSAIEALQKSNETMLQLLTQLQVQSFCSFFCEFVLISDVIDRAGGDDCLAFHIVVALKHRKNNNKQNNKQTNKQCRCFLSLLFFVVVVVVGLGNIRIHFFFCIRCFIRLATMMLCV